MLKVFTNSHLTSSFQSHGSEALQVRPMREVVHVRRGAAQAQAAARAGVTPGLQHLQTDVRLVQAAQGARHGETGLRFTLVFRMYKTATRCALQLSLVLLPLSVEKCRQNVSELEF